MTPRPRDEEDVAALVAAARDDPSLRDRLVDLLPETSAVYEGRSMSTTARLRGWVLAAFEDVTLPPRARVFAIEELQSGVEPYLVAAAAKAVRGGERESALGPHLVSAFRNMQSRDDTVSFESMRPPWPPERPTTALLEILATVRWLGSVSPTGAADWDALRRSYGGRLSEQVSASLAETVRALAAEEPGHGSCCSPAAEGPHATPVSGDVSLTGIELEDQDGERAPAEAFLQGKPVVVAFFYTRCPNPNKCSATVTRLGALQQLLADNGLEPDVKLLAITYDPGYDGPERLRRYGEARGLRFDKTMRMARATAGHHRLRAFFDLQVGYGSSIVNRHAIELFLLDAGGSIVHTWSRLLWDPVEVMQQAGALLPHRC